MVNTVNVSLYYSYLNSIQWLPTKGLLPYFAFTIPSAWTAFPHPHSLSPCQFEELNAQLCRIQHQRLLFCKVSLGGPGKSPFCAPSITLDPIPLYLSSYCMEILAQNQEVQEDGDFILIIFNPYHLAHYLHKRGKLLVPIK